MRAVRHAIVWSMVILALLALFTGSSRVQAGGPSLPSLPPMPPSSSVVVNSAYSRFPDIDKAAVQIFIEQYYPSEMLEVKNTSNVKPDIGLDLMTDLIQESLRMMKLKERYPAQFSKIMKQRVLERRAAALASDIRELEGSKRAKAVEELEKALDGAFDLKQELMKMDLIQLEKDLQNLKHLIKTRADNKQAIVTRRVEAMTGEDADLQW